MERIGRFAVEKSIPVENLAELIGHLKRVEKLIPNWCEQVIVDFSNELGDAALESTTRYDYRRATFWTTPKFFQEKDRQLKCLVHETCHITQEPLWNVLDDVKRRLGEIDKDNVGFINELCRHGREQAVCDMTTLTMKAFEFNVPLP